MLTTSLKTGRIDLFKKPELFESAGLSYFQRAMRSKNPKSFRAWIHQSRNMFWKASRLYRSKDLRGFEFRCLAWQLYLDFYLVKNAGVKKRLLEKSWRFAKQAFRDFDDRGDHLEFAKTYDQLANVAGLDFDYHFTPQLRGRRLKEGVEYGRQSSKAILPDQDRQLLARVCARTALFIDAIGNEGSEMELNEERDKEGLELWRKAEQLDKDEALFQVGFFPRGLFRIVDEEEAHRIHNEALRTARKRGDQLAIGTQLINQSGWTFWEGIRALSLKENIRSMEESLRNAEKAARIHAPAGFTSPICDLIWCAAPYSEHFMAISWFQKNEKSRMLWLEKARRETPLLLRQARRSGYPQAIAYADHVTSKILMDLGLHESGSRRKMRLLRQALRHRLRACNLTARVQPNDLHRNATYLSRLGEIQAAMADLLDDRKSKIMMLTRAVEDKGRSITRQIDYANTISRGQPHILKRLTGVDLIVYGDLLMSLYKASGQDVILERAAKAYSDSAVFLKDTTAFRRLGEAHWKSGEIQDRLRAYLAAAESFALASKAYQTMAEKSPDAGPVFLDYAKYLEAWSNIENARASHRRSDYEESKKYFEKAADLHQLAGRWSFLAPWYTAQATLESAENLSRIGRCLEAISAFKDAAQMFRESTLSLQKQTGFLDQREEKTMVEGIILAFREEYALARVLIEEARIAEDQGDYPTSADKFRDASHLFQESAKKASVKQEKKELLYISTLSQAWEQMARTSASDKGNSFRKAAELFERSVAYSSDDNTSTLSMGHKHFCDALAANRAFTYTLDPVHYEASTKSFTAAANHFATAGFHVQSKHAQGCKLMLDAHAYLAEASKSPDSAKQARDYERIVDILNDAAEQFKEAHQTAKQEQVLKLIDNVHERLGLSQHLAEISKAGTDISPTVAFPTPSSNAEYPVGSSRFTGADIEARYGPSTSINSSPGSDVMVELVIANTGGQPVRLARINGIIAEGARIVGGEGFAGVEGGSLLLDQKRVEPMNVETLKVEIHPRKNNSVIVRPIIVFLDDNGRPNEHKLPLRVLANSPIFEFLIESFLRDYQVQRLATEQCGWRTLSNIVSELRIPRSHVYGEPRWGHAYGRPIQGLITSGLVEARRFAGERGRGGTVVKVRLAYENHVAKQYAEMRVRENEKNMDRS